VARDWIAYFDRLEDHSPLFRGQSAYYVESLTAAMEVHRGQHVLDFGCGFGFVSALLAPLVAHVCFWDPSPRMRSIAERNTADVPNARLCDPSRLVREQLAIDGAGSPFDLILVNSVAQYMAPDELRTWLPRWRELLAPDGKLVLSDLIPPGHGSLFDIADLLRLGARLGFPLRAVGEILGDLRIYWRTRRAMPLVQIGPKDLERAAAAADLRTTVLPRNLTHFSRRWTGVLERRPVHG
jgi:SAM-dependent methyltransferase